MQIQSQSQPMMPRTPSVMGFPGVAMPMPSLQTGQAGFWQTDVPVMQRPIVTPSVSPQPKAVSKPDSVGLPKKPVNEDEASKLVIAYKYLVSVGFGGLGYSFLMGTPLKWSLGIATVVTTLQSAVAMKIRKQDDKFSKGAFKVSGKIMHCEKDTTAGGKERAMVPVWGVACAMIALCEAGFNHFVSSRYVKKSLPPIADRRIAIQEQISKSGGIMRLLYKFQAFGLNIIDRLTKWFGKDLPKSLSPGLKKVYEKVLSKLGQNVKGNPKIGYILGATLAGFGGAFQAYVAARIQKRLDVAKGITPPPKTDKKAEAAASKKTEVVPVKKPTPEVKTESPSPVAENAKSTPSTEDKKAKDQSEQDAATGKKMPDTESDKPSTPAKNANTSPFLAAQKPEQDPSVEKQPLEQK